MDSERATKMGYPEIPAKISERKSCCFCFFIQAKDGIRDLYVTGVQTCALPISRAGARERGAVSQWGEPLPATLPTPPQLCEASERSCREFHVQRAFDESDRSDPKARMVAKRSEERRVGKEYSCRGVRDGERKRR